MSATAAIKRRNDLLRKIAKITQYRAGVLRAVTDIHPTLTHHPFRGAVAVDAVDIESQLAEDLNILDEEQFILLRFGTREGSTENVFVFQLNKSGFELVSEMEKGWWKKAIDKQPITFVQVIIALIQIAVTIALFFWTLHIQSAQHDLEKRQTAVEVVQHLHR